MTLLDLESCGGNPPFVWLHGFTQTAQSGYEFQRNVRATRALCAIDLPGHGTNESLLRNLTETARDIARDANGESIDLGGYSLGGRVALHVAARHSEVLRRLVILSSTAGIVDPAERTERRQRDEELADRCLALGTSAFLAEWTAQPMFAHLPPDAVEYATRSRDAMGLATSLRLMGTGTQVPLDEQLARCLTPTLIVAGENDQKFVREAHRLHECLRHSHLAIVPDAGHAVHLERPEYVARLVTDFLGDEN